MLYNVWTGLSSISGFLVKFLINKNCHNFRTSNNIDMKVGSPPKPEKRNTMTLKIFESDLILVNHDVIVIFLTYSQFGASWKSNSRCTFHNSYFFINNDLLSNKSLTQFSYHLLGKRSYFCPITHYLCNKNTCAIKI